ncbi:MAG: tRNA pseudouridine(55) synthase TruB [Oscillospiraceae bacterium]|nr:tRNA pseudouridine(55) synthase TruB [Oscillospiraceae bacterium]
MKSGVLLVNKPKDFTSFDVIAVLRGVLHEKRLGHTGTLDPMATGVLPVLVGKATKACDILPDNKKGYIAGFKLGIATDTQDITGKVLKKSEILPTKEAFEGACQKLLGKTMQLPPMFSAVKVNGQKLYDLARQGIEVEREPREIEVFSIKLLSFDKALGEGSVEIYCSKGTYIRTIIHDIGEDLGCFGCMTSLVRVFSQGFELEKCQTLDEIKADTEIESKILPIDTLFAEYPSIQLSEKQEKMYKNGIKLSAEKVQGATEEGLYRLYGEEFLGLCKVSDGEVTVYKNFWG